MSYLLRTYDDSMYNDLHGIILESLLDDKNKTTYNMKELMNTLYRFGTFNIVYDREKAIACGGAYVSEFDPNFALIGVRSYVLPEYKNKLVIRNYILTEHKKWAIQNGMQAIGLSFNEYNKNAIKLWSKPRLGSTKLVREPNHFGYLNLNEVPFPVTIQNTKQYVLYENLNSWLYEWENISYHE